MFFHYDVIFKVRRRYLVNDVGLCLCPRGGKQMTKVIISDYEVEKLSLDNLPRLFNATSCKLPIDSHDAYVIMSSFAFICHPFGQLIYHFESSVRLLADASDAQFNVDGRPFNHHVQDLEARAMEVMLKYHAHWLLDMHNALKTDTKAFARFFESFPKTNCQVLSRRLTDVEVASHARLYASPPDATPYHWRQIYSDVQILIAFLAILKPVQEQTSKEHQERAFLKALDEVVARLDRALIISGGAGRILGKSWIDKAMDLIVEICARYPEQTPEMEFSRHEPYDRPQLTHPCERHSGWDLGQFETYMRRGLLSSLKTGAIAPKPIVFTDLTEGRWPALRNWCRPKYLFSMTLGGRRLVPVEIGRSYVDADWGQELMPFKKFVTHCIDGSCAVPDASGTAGLAGSRPPPAAQPGYLAQHDLFQQIPKLRNDILTPDFCWAQVPDVDPITGREKTAKLDMPQVNAWFGPAGTNSPLHTDPYHNLFCQVVGTKYVRLYPPQASKEMRPMATSDSGIDMSNTSSIDLLAVEGWDDDISDYDEETEREMREIKESLRDVQYFECILKPGDTLLIPMGWWHFVRSLSVSFSVSFWWN